MIDQSLEACSGPSAYSLLSDDCPYESPVSSLWSPVHDLFGFHPQSLVSGL